MKNVVLQKHQGARLIAIDRQAALNSLDATILRKIRTLLVEVRVLFRGTDAVPGRPRAFEGLVVRRHSWRTTPWCKWSF